MTANLLKWPLSKSSKLGNGDKNAYNSDIH